MRKAMTLPVGSNLWYYLSMLGKFFNKILGEDEQADEKEKEISKEKKTSRKDLLIAFILFGLALAVRLYSLFYITDAQNSGVEVWYSDTYHHWQIAYLTKTIGLKQGFLRLWDLKGMEYFWGAAHPLVGALLITLTGSTSIVVFRVLSSVMGSLAIAFLYLIVRRHWNAQAGLAAAVLGILSPVGMFNDASGMVEPLGIVAVLAGIYFFPKRPLLSGLILAFAGMVRAEFWLLGLFILFGMFLIKVPSQKKPLVAVGYLVPILLYMKYLLDKTGNPIYPIWWNYMGNAAGEWQADIPPTATQLAIQKIYWAIAGISSVGLLATLWKRPKHTPFFLFGFGNWFIWGVVIGMTSYLLSYLPRFWVDRIMLWPYLFLGSIIAIMIFGIVPKKIPKKITIPLSISGWLLIALILVVIQAAWRPIHHYYDDAHKYWDNLREISQEFSEVDTHEGRVLVPEDWPPLIYMLVHFEGLEGKRIVGQMFDPFFYMEGDPYESWGENREIALDWLQKEDVRLMFFLGNRERYLKLIEREPEYFQEVKHDTDRNLYFYRVDQERLRNRI